MIIFKRMLKILELNSTVQEVLYTGYRIALCNYFQANMQSCSAEVLKSLAAGRVAPLLTTVRQQQFT